MRMESPSCSSNGAKPSRQNKAYLGEVDGLIGDGDHGMNMNKGLYAVRRRGIGGRGDSPSPKASPTLGNTALLGDRRLDGPDRRHDPDGRRRGRRGLRRDRRGRPGNDARAQAWTAACPSLQEIVQAQVGDKTPGRHALSGGGRAAQSVQQRAASRLPRRFSRT